MNNLTTRKSYQHLTDIELRNPTRLIWLASWYPSKTDAYNGDFIQRHAIAVSRILPLTVIHTIHDPDSATRSRYEVVETDGLTEIYVYFHHSGNVTSLPSRFRYNQLYYYYTKTLLTHLFQFYTRPACLHVHVPLKMGRVALWAKRKWSIPFFVSEQSSAYLPGAEDSYHRRNLLYRVSVKRILKKATAISNVSQTLGRVLEHIAGRNDVVVIRNAADPAVFFCKPQTNSVFSFIHVSTLKEQKNIAGILQAFSLLYNERQDFTLKLIGGHDGAFTKDHPGYSNIPWLKLVGSVDHPLVARHMQQSDCLVMFSRDENFPCVIVEALCCGLPVVTSDAGGCAEAINQDNGLVVRTGDQEGLISALQNMLANHSHYNMESISRKAAALYSYDKVAHDFIDLYKKSGIKID